MKRSILYVCIAFTSLIFCTGCFDLNEYLFLRKDGSGKFSFIVDMSKMMAMSKMFEESGETKKTDESEKLTSSFEKSKKRIQEIQGISGYTEISDTINYKFGFTFDFKNMTALNKALNIVFEDSLNPNTNYTYFELKNNTLSRQDAADVKKLIQGSSASEKSSSAASKKPLFNFDMVFSDITYNTIYEFEQPVDSVSNKASMFSADKSKIHLTCHPFAKDSVSMACTLKNKIFLK